MAERELPGHREYSKEDVTVIWKPELCQHSTLCFKGLRSVFDPSKRPWVNMDGASVQRILEQVRRCPSGALSYTETLLSR